MRTYLGGGRDKQAANADIPSPNAQIKAKENNSGQDTKKAQRKSQPNSSLQMISMNSFSQLESNGVGD